jgi:basic membrane protein A
MGAKMRLIRGLSVLAASALLLTGCSAIGPNAEVTDVDYKACIAASVSTIEAGSIDDQALDGVQRAVVKQGVGYKLALASEKPNTESYVNQLKGLIAADCDFVVAVSNRMAAATYRVAKANPDVRFALVDAELTTSFGQAAPLENVRELRFDAAQSAFLAGYLAASATKSGVVAAFGANRTTQIVEVITGFKQGVDYFNSQNGTSVSIIGAPGSDPRDWSVTGAWADSAAQTKLAYRLATRGADVIFGYTGSVVLGANPSTSGEGENTGTDGNADAASPMFIGIDTDWAALAANDAVKGSILASMPKRIAPVVESTVAAGLTDTFVGGIAGRYVGTLSDGGVALTEAGAVTYPTGVAGRLAQLVSEINDGTIVVDSSINNK